MRRTQLVCIAALVAMVTCTHGQSWLTHGLIAYYPFNGNANDASGNGYNLINNGATYGTNNLGIPNSAVWFNSGTATPPSGNGNNSFGGQWMSFGTAKPLDNLTNLTISLWLRPGKFLPPAYGNAANEWILYQESVVIIQQLGNGPQRFGFYTGNGNIGGWYPGLEVANGTFGFSTNGTWVHCVYTVDATGQKLYANGSLAVSNSTGVPQIGTNSYSLGLGAYYNGAIGNFRIYNRTLSANEVAQLYAHEAGLLNIRKAVYLDTSGLIIGSTYQLQISSDLANWTNQGAPFTATDSNWRSTNYWDVDNWNQLFFRLQPQ